MPKPPTPPHDRPVGPVKDKWYLLSWVDLVRASRGEITGKSRGQILEALTSKFEAGEIPAGDYLVLQVKARLGVGSTTSTVTEVPEDLTP